jgi:hypothetical protein
MNKSFLTLLAIQDKRELSHIALKEVNIVRLVLDNGTKFEAGGTDFDKLSDQVLAYYTAYLTSQAEAKARCETLERELLAYAETKKLTVTFAISEIVTQETHPSKTTTTAHLHVGDEVFTSRFVNCSKEKMRASLIKQAHEVLVEIVK